MSASEYLKIINEQKGFRAAIKRCLFSGMLQELAKQEEEISKQQQDLLARFKDLDDVVKANFKNQYSKLDYYDFENRFRGPVEVIKQRQSMYLPYVRDKHSVLDFGCGRGEFLELMKENGIPAKGVDIYQGYVDLCRGTGLDVVQGDGLEYLENVQEAFDAIFVGQVVEHLDVDSIITLCKLAYKKLTSNGVLIIETPNPRCLSIFSNAFYMDPSHIKPVHPATLQYYLEKSGFTNCEIIDTECSRCSEHLPEIVLGGEGNVCEFNLAISKLSEKLYGSQDYCVIAYKQFNCMSKMVVGPEAESKNNKYCIDTNGFIYGPYIDLYRGDYRLTVVLWANKLVKLKITSDDGTRVLLEQELSGGENVINLQISEFTKRVEFVVSAVDSGCVVEEIKLERIL